MRIYTEESRTYYATPITSLLYTNDVILTNQSVFSIMTLNILRRDNNFDTNPEFPSTPSSFKRSRNGRVAHCWSFNIVRTDRRCVKKTGASTFTVKTNEITRKHLILCSSISVKWQKTLKTPNKVAGPVGKEGVLDGVNRCRNAGKSAKT